MPLFNSAQQVGFEEPLTSKEMQKLRYASLDDVSEHLRGLNKRAGAFSFRFYTGSSENVFQGLPLSKSRYTCFQDHASNLVSMVTLPCERRWQNENIAIDQAIARIESSGQMGT